MGTNLAWSIEAHLLGGIEHASRVIAWQNTTDGSTGDNFPERLTPTTLFAAPETQAQPQAAEPDEETLRMRQYLQRTANQTPKEE